MVWNISKKKKKIVLKMPRQSDLNTKNLLCIKPNSYAKKNTKKKRSY